MREPTAPPPPQWWLDGYKKKMDSQNALEELINAVAASIYKDAERYRWLRSIEGCGAAAFEISRSGDPVPDGILIGGHLDDFIDAAIAREKEQ